jgi:glutamate dehydrogenase/leucine dehydrogenase
LENISKAFARALNTYIGEKIDIPVLDMSTNSKIIDVMAHEYSCLHPENLRSKGSFTGKSVEYGGSKGRTEATGRGVGDHTCYLQNNDGFYVKEMFEYCKKNRCLKGMMMTKIFNLNIFYLLNVQ